MCDIISVIRRTSVNYSNSFERAASCYGKAYEGERDRDVPSTSTSTSKLSLSHGGHWLDGVMSRPPDIMLAKESRTLRYMYDVRYSEKATARVEGT